MHFAWHFFNKNQVNSPRTKVLKHIEDTINYFQITTYKMQYFLDLFIYTDVLHVSSGSSAHHQAHKNCANSFRYCQPILLLAAIAASSNISLQYQQPILLLATIAASSSIGLQYLKLYVQFLCSWWWAEEPLETCRTSVEMYKSRKCCILLVVIWKYICDARTYEYQSYSLYFISF